MKEDDPLYATFQSLLSREMGGGCVVNIPRLARRLADLVTYESQQVFPKLEISEDGTTITRTEADGTVAHARNVHWRLGMRRPTAPGAYWNPEVNGSEVWTLNHNGEWHHNLSGTKVNLSHVPDGLQLLGLLQ